MAFNSQLIRARNIVVSPNKQTTYGTALADANLTHNMRFGGDAFATFPEKEYFTDLDLAKGHPWASVRKEISRGARLSIGNIPAYDFIAAWLAAFLLGKVTTTGIGPYTHVFNPDLSTTIAPVTTVWIKDTADVLYKLPDMALASLRIGGGIVGPISADAELVGSGRNVEGTITPIPALVDPVFILNNDTDVLLGPQAAPVSIKERVRSWQVTIASNVEAYRGPGGGLVASFHRKGDLRVSVSLAISAKDVDDIRTLLLNDTKQELRIEANSGAAAQLKFKFYDVIFRGAGAAEGSHVVWNIEADETGVLKDAATELFDLTVINNQATFLVAA